MSNAEDRASELYRKYAPAIYARCRRMLNNAAAAEDATQETFIRVCRHVDRIPSDEEALRWMQRIATNYCLNEVRNLNTRSSLSERRWRLLIAQNGEEVLVERDLGRRLVDRAPEKIRAAAWLHLVDGLEQKEVAAALGVSRRTVVNHLSCFLKSAKKFAAQNVA